MVRYNIKQNGFNNFRINYNKFLLFNLLLFYYNDICYGMLPNSSKMSDICWGDEEIFVDPQNIPLLLYYFRSCLQATELLETSDKRRLLDTLLGRVNSVLPEVKFEYYNGNIDYDIVDNLYDLINEIQIMELSFPEVQSQYYFGYDTPSRLHRSPNNFKKITPLRITANINEQKEACDSLIFKNKTTGVNKNSSNITITNTNKVSQYIPIPILRKVHKNPDSLAVPLRAQSIYSVKNEGSKEILMNFYITSLKCLMLSKRHTKREISDFNKSFCLWIEREIMPYVSTHQYYPAFSGVLKIIRTMDEKGYATECTDRIIKKRSVIVKKNRGKEEPNRIPALESSGHIGNTDSTNISFDYDEFLKSAEKGVTTSDILDDLPNSSDIQLNLLSEVSPEKITTIFAFLLALLLATWVIAGSLCITCCYRRNKRERDECEFQDGGFEEPCPLKQKLSCCMSKSKHGNSCPYEKGEKVVVMMKDEGGVPQYYYGTFHVDKTKPCKNIRDDPMYENKEALAVYYDNDQRSTTDMDSTDDDLRSLSSRIQPQKSMEEPSYASVVEPNFATAIERQNRRKAKSLERLRFPEDERQEYIEEYESEEHSEESDSELKKHVVEEIPSAGKTGIPHARSAHITAPHSGPPQTGSALAASSHKAVTQVESVQIISESVHTTSSPTKHTASVNAVVSPHTTKPTSSVAQVEIPEKPATPESTEKEDSSAASTTTATTSSGLASVTSASSRVQVGSSHTTEPLTEVGKVCVCVPSKSCPHGGTESSKICTCPCKKGGAHYEKCHNKQVKSYEPHRTNSVILGESFTPATGVPSYTKMVEPGDKIRPPWYVRDDPYSTNTTETHSDYCISQHKHNKDNTEGDNAEDSTESSKPLEKSGSKPKGIISSQKKGNKKSSKSKKPRF